MFRNVTFLAILVWVVGCYVDKDRRAEIKSPLIQDQEEEIETFYLASVTAGIDMSTGQFVDDKYTGEFMSDTQTITLTKLDYNYTTGEATVRVKTVNKHGILSNECDELLLKKGHGNIAGAYEELGENGLHAKVEFTNDPKNGSQLNFYMRGWGTKRGHRVEFHYADSAVRVDKGMARIVRGERLMSLSSNIRALSHVDGDSSVYRNYMEAIHKVPGYQEANEYNASTGLMRESFLNDNKRMRSLSNPGVPKLDGMRFWRDAFSNCSSSHQSDSGQ